MRFPLTLESDVIQNLPTYNLGHRAQDLAPGFASRTFRIAEKLFELCPASAFGPFRNIIGYAISRTGDLILEAPISAF